jgi:protein-tyrosine phosphatase
MNNTNPCDEILPNLYLGSIKALGSYECKSLDYYLVVDLIKHTILLDKSETIANTKIYINLPVHDSPDECDNLLSLIYETQVLEKMQDCIINNKPVLVHCFAGMQRSACIMAMYLIAKKGMTWFQSIAFVKSVRPIAFTPQANFKSSIIAFDKSYHEDILPKVHGIGW